MKAISQQLGEVWSEELEVVYVGEGVGRAEPGEPAMEVKVPGPPHIPLPVCGDGARDDYPRPFGFQCGQERSEVSPQGLGFVNIIGPDVYHQVLQAGVFGQDGRQHP